MERSRRCRRRHAAPRAASGCPLVSAIDGHTCKNVNANLSEPVVVVVEWLYYFKRIMIVRWADLCDFFSSIFVGKMCLSVSRPMKIVTFHRKNDYHPKRVVDFPRERNTFRNKIMEIVEDFDEKSYNNNGKPWKSSRILRVNPFFSFSFFFHYFSPFFSFFLSFFHFSFFFIFSFFAFFHFFHFLRGYQRPWHPFVLLVRHWARGVG